MEYCHLNTGQSVRIEGPALVKVLEGKVYAVGITYGSNDKFTILRARKVVIKALEDTKLQVTLGQGGKIERVIEGEEVIDIWEREISKLKLRNSIITILGAMDVGKTTLTITLANKASISGLKVGIIDADLGQNDLGPPATIDAAILKDDVLTHLSSLRPVKSLFLKTTSVEKVWRDVVDSVHKLTEYLMNIENVDTVVINTDGWVSTKEAIKYKYSLIEKLNPNYIIVIKREDEVDNLISNLNEKFSDRLLILPAPQATRTRTREDRKIHREMGYGRYLMPTRELSINLEKTPITNIPICSGVQLSDELKRLISKFVKSSIKYAEQIGESVIVVSDVKENQIINMPGGGEVIVLPLNWERGLLVGLEDENNYLLALGCLRKIYYHQRKAVITISRNFEETVKIHHIRLGMIRLNENFEEEEKVNYLLKIEKILSRHIH